MIAEAVAVAPEPPVIPALPITPLPPAAVPNPPPASKITVAQYLEMERKAQTRHEYVDGKLIAIAGESRAQPYCWKYLPSAW